ncbi:hypothetical protein ACIRD4_35740 [Streptomyces clavifer]|uniref:ATP-dependent DNA ligase n=1 Tax=Streptomyces clavifer TaxID=68188 RepID=UPI0038017B42
MSWCSPGRGRTSRRGADLRGALPELVRSAAELGVETVLDAELVVWGAQGLDSPALQERALRRGATAQRTARELPAHLIVFDVLEMSGDVLLDEPLRRRRAALEDLFHRAAAGSPVGAVPADFRPGDRRRLAGPGVGAAGIEGVVIKDPCSRYRRGERGWLKLRTRMTTEGIIGAVTGTVHSDQPPARPVRPCGPAEADRPFHAAVPACGGRAGPRPPSRWSGTTHAHDQSSAPVS